MFDIGSLFGGVVLGFLTDLTYSRRTPILVLYMILALGLVISLIYINTSQHLFFNAIFLIFGFFLSGVTNTIAGLSSAEIGKEKSLKSNKKALATITGIIDGVGSAGVAIG